MKDFDLVVIGGGPAGILAAGKAASEGVNVLLLEKMEKPARKLRITGKGRCNITNVKPLDDFIEEIFPDGQFLRDAFKEFFAEDIVKLLNEQGVETVVERGQRVFPASGKAWDVAEGLIRWAKSFNVEFINHAKVEKINVVDGKTSSVDYINTTSGQKNSIKCKSVVIASGGLSYPATGSTGDGYELAKFCGHSIVPLRPTLVGFETSPVLKQSAGLTLKNINLTLFIEGKKVDEEFGELELTPYGLSGPIILRVSRKIVDALSLGKAIEVTLDLKPALDHQKLDARLQRDIEDNPRGAVIDLARGLLPKELAFEMIDNIGLAAQKNLARLSLNERKAIRLWLKELKFTILSHRSWDEAIATAGGVSLKEVNPRTMESKLLKGLFFAGEVLDLDGNTGGYNLQIAYSTGWLAGIHSAKYALAYKKIEH